MFSLINRFRIPVIFSVIGLTVLFDQILKFFASSHLKDSPSFTWFNGFFYFQYAENTGAFLSFGAFLPPKLRLLIFTVLVSIILFATLFFLIKKNSPPLQTLAFSLLIGGGIGNLIDRAFYGYVVDFLMLDFGFARTGIFNLADVFIVIGVTLLLLFSKNESRHEPRKESRDDPK